MRIDRLATLYFFHPLRRRAFSPSAPCVPVLMYHSVSDGEENGLHPYYRTCTSPGVFRGHMKALHENGYEVVGLSEAVERLQAGGSGGRKCAVITFDDGFRDFYDKAYPVLAEHGFGATVFLPTEYIRQSSARFKGKDCLTWSEVRELAGKGIVFGSHTETHRKLIHLGEREIEGEVERSKKKIEDETGIPVESFSYPYAFPEENRTFREFMRGALQRACYSCGVSTAIGLASRESDRYFLRRIPVNSCDDDALFRAKLEGGYDWLHGVQLSYKKIKGHLARRHAGGLA